jgi:hypothetical protein
MAGGGICVAPTWSLEIPEVFAAATWVLILFVLRFGGVKLFSKRRKIEFHFRLDPHLAICRVHR